MKESAEKKFLGMYAFIVAVLGLFSTFLIVVAVLGAFTFNSIRAGNARIAAMLAERQAGIEALCAERKADSAALRAEQKASVEGLRAEQKADIDMLSDKVDVRDAKIDALDDNLDTRLDESERQRARTQGALEMRRGRQAPNP